MTIALRSTVQTSQGTPSTHTAITGIVTGDLYIDIAHNTGGGTAPALDATSAFTTMGSGTDSSGRTWRYGYRVRDGSEGTLSATGAAALADIFFALQGASGIESFQSANTGVVTTYTIPASTPTADNCWHVIVAATTSAGGNTIPTPPTGYTLLGSRAVSGQGTIYAYYKDLGAGSSGVSTGTVSATWSTTAGGLAAGFIVKPAASGPAVTGVTGTSPTEGSNIVFTVSLSGATAGTTNYAATLSGTATGADYDNNLANATYSTGASYSGGNIVIQSGYSGCTVTIATTQDALDEDNETIILTVGGVASTGGSIADDDALPALSMTSTVTVTEGDNVVITVTLGAVSGRVVQGTLTLTNGTKTGGVDFVNAVTNGMLSNGVTISAGVLSIPAGVATFTITIPTTP